MGVGGAFRHARLPRRPLQESACGAAHPWDNGRSYVTACAVPAGSHPGLARAGSGMCRTARIRQRCVRPATKGDTDGAPGEKSPGASTGSGGATDGDGATHVAPRRGDTVKLAEGGDERHGPSSLPTRHTDARQDQSGSRGHAARRRVLGARAAAIRRAKKDVPQIFRMNVESPAGREIRWR